ncbi:hypothetical protein MRB53_040528 [Persea americana]|nr:hypothetical protein MRB53_040528 [Persea americana]
MKFGFAAALSLVASINALNIITPTADTVVSRSSTFPLRWSTDPSDPKNFTIAYSIQDSDSDPVPANSLQYQSSTGFVTLRGSIFPTPGTYTLFLLDSKTSTILTHSQPFTVADVTSTGTSGMSGTIIGPFDGSATATSTASAGGGGGSDIHRSNAASALQSSFGLAVVVLAFVMTIKVSWLSRQSSSVFTTAALAWSRVRQKDLTRFVREAFSASKMYVLRHTPNATSTWTRRICHFPLIVSADLQCTGSCGCSQQQYQLVYTGDEIASFIQQELHNACLALTAFQLSVTRPFWHFSANSQPGMRLWTDDGGAHSNGQHIPYDAAKSKY